MEDTSATVFLPVARSALDLEILQLSGMHFVLWVSGVEPLPGSANSFAGECGCAGG